jgi:hypothetical protein
VNKKKLLNNKFPFTLGNIIIDSELLNNVINEINPETLVEWYCLTQYDLKTMQNRLESYGSSALTPNKPNATF